MKQRQYLSCALALLLTACGSGGGGGGAKKPSNFSYTDPDGRYLVQVEIEQNKPKVKGQVKSWSVTPALPNGLALDPKTGVLSGTPLAVSPQATYTVTAKGPGGQATTTIRIAIDKPPRFAFSCNPDDDSFSAYVVDAWSGGLDFGTVTDSGASETGPEDVVFHPNGNFAFVPNRGSRLTPSTVSTYGFDEDSGALTHLGEVACGEGPRRFALTPDGRNAFAIAYDSNEIFSYDVDPATGVLTPLGVQTTNTGPTEIAVDPLGRFVYLTHGPSADVLIFHIDPVTGAVGPFVDGINYWGFVPTDVVAEPTGNFLYIAFEDTDKLLAYAINQVTGALSTLVEEPLTGSPKDLALPPHGGYLYVANEEQDNVTLYALDEVTGLPQHLIDFPVGDAPTAVVFDESGLYTYVLNSGSDDVSVFEADPNTGDLTAMGRIRTNADAACFAVFAGSRPALPRAEFLYVLNEESSDVSGFTFDNDGGALASTGPNSLTGDAPEGVAIDPLGRFLFVANGDDMNVSSYSIAAGTGVLSENVGRLALGATPGGVAVDARGETLFVTLESSDEVVAFAIDPATGALTETDRAATGNGPRGITADPTGQFVFVSNVVGASDTLAAYRVKDGVFQTGPILEPAPGNPGQPRVAPDGSRLYAALQGVNLITPYAIDPATGALTVEGAGALATATTPSVVDLHPRSEIAFAAVPGSSAQNGWVARLTVDGAGGLGAAGQTFDGLSPFDVRVGPGGRYLFSANNGGDDVTVFTIDAASGDLALSSTLAAGLSPTAVVYTMVVD